MDPFDDEDVLPDDEFSRKAYDLGLSVDASDLLAFILDEIGKFVTVGPVKGISKLREQMQDIIPDLALDRILVGVRLTGLSESDIRSLRAAGTKVAQDLLAGIDPTSCQDREANLVREALLQIYERFLLWMRLTRDAATSATAVGARSLEELLEDMHELVQFIDSLNDPDLPEQETIKRFQSADGAEYRRYASALNELEMIVSPHSRARFVPRSGRVSHRTILERQGYSASKYLYELDITIEETRPSVYRTLSIPGNRTLADLHLCIQNAFGWQDYHLHEFVLNGTSFGEPTDDDWHPVVWDDIVSLDELRLKTGDKFL